MSVQWWVVVGGGSTSSLYTRAASVTVHGGSTRYDHIARAQNEGVHLLELGAYAGQLLNGIVLHQIVRLGECACHVEQGLQCIQLALLVRVLTLQYGNPGVSEALIVANLCGQLGPFAYAKDVSITPARLLANGVAPSEAHLTVASAARGSSLSFDLDQ